MQKPKPPTSFLDQPENGIRLIPAPEVWEWLQAEVLADTGSIHNEDHAHLLDADIKVMWASSSFEKQGRTVLGQAEQVAFRAGGWQKARMEQQMRDWFGDVPAFIITLAADYCVQCSDVDFCALVEHELYHIAQATDKYGQPAFTDEVEGFDKQGKLSASTLDELKAEFANNTAFAPLIVGSKASGGGAGGAGHGGGAALKRSEMTPVAKREYLTAHGQDAYLKLPK
ncbi:putative metallopeptidase [Pseudomonas sp. GL-R-19]|uniref:putative metallopeptidase n=1 Tax=Pseudomonas sp. GL-R-19 TaxID=2832391 RepID=UPI001CC04672|nr:putative metallopeptidase [Pseudomonas sp. GL-R-19]